MRNWIVATLLMWPVGAHADIFDVRTAEYVLAVTKSCGADHGHFDSVIEASMMGIIRAQRTADLRTDEGLYYVARKEREKSQVLAAELATRLFYVADKALGAGCLSTADRYYRRIIEIFTGTSYASYRQRAQIGIDDVRSRRSSRAR
jgi:hypothetical protein